MTREMLKWAAFCFGLFCFGLLLGHARLFGLDNFVIAAIGAGAVFASGV